jgi:hypothetical protein
MKQIKITKEQAVNLMESGMRLLVDDEYIAFPCTFEYEDGKYNVDILYEDEILYSFSDEQLENAYIERDNDTDQIVIEGNSNGKIQQAIMCVLSIKNTLV